MSDAAVLHVVFRLADAEYAVPARDVVQLESFQGATPVPGSPAWITGLIQIRGRVIPVVDLRARFGHAAATVTADSRVVVVRRGDRTVGLLVDLAREVRNLDPGAISPAPETLRDATGGMVQAIARDDQRLTMMIDLELILGAERHG